MKMRNITTIITGIIFGVSLLMFGCNVYGPMQPETAEPGKGKVIVNFSAGRAALSPAQMDFDNYEFTFYRYGAVVDSDVRGKNEAFVFTLETGPGYTLEVKAYKGEPAEENLAAIGETESFTVSASTAVTVYLDGFLKDGPKGYFSYNIIYPQDAVVEELTLRINKDNNWDLLDSLTAVLSGGVVSDTLELSAGKYFFIIRLSMNDGTDRAGYANGVEIMSGHTTYFGTGGDPVVFTLDDFDTLPELPPGPARVITWRGFDVEGMSHYYNNDRATNGRLGELWSATNWIMELDGNYDPSRAVGYQHQSFTDANGKTWNDVLQLDPPQENNPLYYRSFGGWNGYEEYTIAMSYPLYESGTYKLSMWYQLEGGTEHPNVFWQTTGGRHNISMVTVAGNTNDMERGKPIYLEGTFTTNLADQEVGLLARTYGNGGGLRDATIYILDLRVEKQIPPVVEVETISTWEEFEAAFDIPGTGYYDNGGGYYYGSEANYDFVDYQGYENVLKLEPRTGKEGNVGIAMQIMAPYSGTYTFTMDVWVDPTQLGMSSFIWYKCPGWDFIINQPLSTGAWVTYTGTKYLSEGEATGLQTHLYGSNTSFMDTAIYFRNFRLDWNGSETPIVNIVCESSGEPPDPPDPPDPPIAEQITSWEEFEAAFDIPGVRGPGTVGLDGNFVPNAHENPAGYFCGSEANYDFVDFGGYENVLRLEPRTDVYPQVGMALLYNAPTAGTYTFTVDVWVDPTQLGMNFTWYGCITWPNPARYEYIINQPLVTGEWKTYTGTLYLNEGDLTGFYTHFYGTHASLMDTTVYFRSIKIECDNVPLVDIECPPAALPPNEDQGVTLEWDDDGVQLKALVSENDLISQNPLTIRQGGTVTLTTQGDYNYYNWSVGGVTVSNTNSYVFTGISAGTYTIILWVNGDESAASIKVKVE